MPDVAHARSTGGGTGRGAGVGHSGPAGLSTQGIAGGPMTGGGESFGPGGAYNGGMTGGYQSYGPPGTTDFQASQYGYPGMALNVPYEQEGSASYQQTQYPGVSSGPALASAVPAPGSVSSLQARGISPGTCLWQCTAEYTPIECQQICQQ